MDTRIDIHRAEGWLARLRGLIGTASWPGNRALHLRPCNAVHTCFMRYAIDVVFVDRRGRIVKVVAGLKRDYPFLDLEHMRFDTRFRPAHPAAAVDSLLDYSPARVITREPLTAPPTLVAMAGRDAITEINEGVAPLGNIERTQLGPRRYDRLLPVGGRLELRQQNLPALRDHPLRKRYFAAHREQRLAVRRGVEQRRGDVRGRRRRRSGSGSCCGGRIGKALKRQRHTPGK